MNDLIKTDNHALSLDNRHSLNLTGVLDVDDFNSSELHIKTSLGKLLVRGKKLKVDSLDLKSGSLSISGEVDALVYSVSTDNSSFFKRLFT